jgi:hypothetical protein
MTLRLALTCLCLLGTATPGLAAKSVLDCRKDRNAATLVICGSPEYVAMVREIDALTDRARARFAPDDRRRLAQSELAFYRKRQGCAWAAHNSAHPGVAVDECIRASLEGRVRALRIMVDRGGF